MHHVKSCYRCLQRADKDIRCPRSGDTGDCKVPDKRFGDELGSSAKEASAHQVISLWPTILFKEQNLRH